MFNLKNLGKPKSVDTSVVKTGVEQVKVKEKVVFNIMDTDILKNLAYIAGCDVEKIREDEFDRMLKSVQDGKGSEWYIADAGVKFYIDDKGGITLMSKDTPENVKANAQEMGMSSIG